MKTPLVMIEWLDSAQPAPQWRFLTDLEPGAPIACISVGWLVQDDQHAKALAQNIGEANDPDCAQASGVILIPTCCITRIVRLHEGRAIRRRRRP